MIFMLTSTHRRIVQSLEAENRRLSDLANWRQAEIVTLTRELRNAQHRHNNARLRDRLKVVTAALNKKPEADV